MWTSVEGLPPLDWPVNMFMVFVCLFVFVFIDDWCKRAQPSLDGTTTMQLLIDCPRNQAEQATVDAGKQCSSVVSDSSSCCEFLPWLPSYDRLGLGFTSQINPFPPRLLLDIMFITATEKLTRTPISMSVSPTDLGDTSCTANCCSWPTHSLVPAELPTCYKAVWLVVELLKWL